MILIMLKNWHVIFEQVYVGGLRSDANKYDIEDEFSKYGNVCFF